MNLRIILAFIALLNATAYAQFRVDVAGVGQSQIPVAMSKLSGDTEKVELIRQIIDSDMTRSGAIKLQKLGTVQTETQTPSLIHARMAGNDYLIVGSIKRLANKPQFELSIRVWDALKEKDLGAVAFTYPLNESRLAAHRASDFVYEKVTGERGAFSTRIAYVEKDVNTYNLWISDIDGGDAQLAMSSPDPIISPAWSPDGRRLAYVSFEERKPRVYVHELSTGERKLVANFPGSNSSPAWAPNGKGLVVALTLDQHQQLYKITLDGRPPEKLTNSTGIDTEAVFHPDGKSLFFVSDRNGDAQIFQLELASRTVRQITHIGFQSTSPSISNDGHWLTFIGKTSEGYKVYVQSLLEQGGDPKAISDSFQNERPTFSPNGKLIVFATKKDRLSTLMTTTLDGRVKSVLMHRKGDMREPSWGPYMD